MYKNYFFTEKDKNISRKPGKDINIIQWEKI